MGKEIHLWIKVHFDFSIMNVDGKVLACSKEKTNIDKYLINLDAPIEEITEIIRLNVYQKHISIFSIRRLMLKERKLFDKDKHTVHVNIRDYYHEPAAVIDLLGRREKGKICIKEI